jgi:hypothetical protein
MKHHLRLLVASTALIAVGVTASNAPAADYSSPSAQIILAQASGGASTGNNSTSGGGSAEPGQVDPRLAPPNAPEGPKGAGGTAGPETTGSIPDSSPSVDSNNSGSGGSNSDSGPLDPRRTPPNAPVSGR